VPRFHAIIAVAGVAAGGLVGCVAGSNEIASAPVPIEHYLGSTCQELESEARATAAQAKAVSGVTTTGAPPADTERQIVWPSLFFVNGNGAHVEKFGELRGRFEALKLVSEQKSCGLSFVGP